MSGSGSIDAPDVGVSVVTVRISGSGEIELSGTTDDLEVSISGSGDFEGADLVARRGDISISGSGAATINVSDQLDAEITGSGDIEYLGDPSVNANTSGSGDIRRN